MLLTLLPIGAAPVALANPGTDLIITGVIDGPLSGGLPKAVEFYAVNAIPDLSSYGFGSANNGGGSDGEEFTFPADSAAAGDFIYVASESTGFTTFFGFAPDYTSSAANINGDDAIELFNSSVAEDVFGDINVDGTGQPWEHLDGWAYRVDDTGPDGSTFALANWTFSGPNALDGETTNATAATPFPIGSYTAGPPVVTLLINELDADQSGTDAAEFIEIYDGGAGSTALDGYVLVLFNGSGDVAYEAFDLDGQATGADGYFVLCGDAANVANCDLDVSPNTNLIQNGAEAAALYTGDAADFVDGTAVTTTDLIDAIVYDTDDADDAGLLVLLNAGQPQVNERGGGDGTAHSNQRCPNGSGGARNTDSYDQYLPTPGVANVCVAPALDLTIVQIQTPVSGDASPYVGVRVRTQGVVTADFGIHAFIQDGTGAFSGLMLYQPDGDFEVGDLVEVEGYVSEYYGLTQIASADLTVLGAGTMPASEVLTSSAISAEDWESVLVRAETVTVTDGDLGYGEWEINDGSGAAIVDDWADYSYDPTTGDALDFVQGPLTYAYGDFKIEPRDITDIGLGYCGAPQVAIPAIQGSGYSSPYEDVLLWTEGVVSADFQFSSQLSGFFLEDLAGDGDAATSDGIFVYHRNSWGYDVDTGDHVRLLATVDEFYGLTQLTYVDDLLTCATALPVTPTPANLPLSNAERESLEGMLLSFPQTLYVTDTYALHTYGEAWLTEGGVAEQPTNEFGAGTAEMDALAADNMARSILLDDGSSWSDPNPIPYLRPSGDPVGTLRIGDSTSGLTAALSYGYSQYRLEPVGGVTFAATNPRPVAAPDVGGDIRVGSMNVLNFWTTIDCPDPDDCRGAHDADQLTAQTDKLVAALLGMDADVIALQEMENDLAHLPITTLVDAMNAVAGAGTWEWIGELDYYNVYPIRNEIIYRPDAVTPYGDPMTIADPAFDATRPGSTEPIGRPPVAQTFDALAGGRFTVMVNHFKSKGSSCASIGDPGLGDGQGNCNLTRVAQAARVLEFVDDLAAIDPDVLVVGDLNSYLNEDPILTLEEGGLINLVSAYDANPYSYSFFASYSFPYVGRGLLDHALATPSLAGQVSGTEVWHINADEPRALDWYDPTITAPGGFRASDHDPVVIGIELDGTPPELAVEVSPRSLWPPRHRLRRVEATVTASDDSGTVYVELVSVTSSEADCCLGDGDRPNDIVILDADTFKLRAERYAKAGRIYRITYRAYDSAGNETIVTARVRVPHDRGNRLRLRVR